MICSYQKIVRALALCALLGMFASVPARANWWDNLRSRAGSMLDGQEGKRDAARKARSQASNLEQRAQDAHTRLALAQRELFRVNQNFYGITSQIKRTEAKIVRGRHRQFLVNERYNRRRILFGRRLAAMQRSGNLSYLQIFLGSSTLSDLTRRFYLFRALIDRDAQLQSELKADKSEIQTLNAQLEREWSARKSLQSQADRERARVAQAALNQQKTLKQLVNSRNDLLVYARSREAQIKELDRQVLAFNARQQTAAREAARVEEQREAEAEAFEARREAQQRQYAEEDRRRSARRRYVSNDNDEPRSTYRSSYRNNRSSYRSSYRTRNQSSYRRARTAQNYSQSGSSYRRSRTRYRSSRPRYRTVRLARRVERVRNVTMAGGQLKPMKISEIVFNDTRVPVSSGSGSSSSGNSNGGGSSSGGSSNAPPPPATDDFPASDP